MPEDQFDLYGDEPEADDDRPNDPTRISHAELKKFVERIERLEEEKKTIGEDIKQVYAEAKGRGYDGKAMRSLIRRRKLDKAEREQQDALLALYEEVFS